MKEKIVVVDMDDGIRMVPQRIAAHSSSIRCVYCGCEGTFSLRLEDGSIKEVTSPFRRISDKKERPKRYAHQVCVAVKAQLANTKNDNTAKP